MKRRRKKYADDMASELDAEEQRLFLQAFYHGVLPKKKKVAASNKLDKPVPENDRTEHQTDDGALFLSAIAQGLDFSHKKDDDSRVKPNDTRSKKRDVVDARIDLHGLCAQDALERLIGFIEHQAWRDRRVLLIVHGKGSGILRKTVMSMMESHPCVADFRVAPPRLGGMGALIVRLKKKKGIHQP